MRLPDIFRGAGVTRTVHVTLEACLTAVGDDALQGHIDYALKRAHADVHGANTEETTETARGFYRWRVRSVWKWHGIRMPASWTWFLEHR